MFQKETTEKKSLEIISEKLTNLLKDQVSNGIRDLSTGRTLIKKSTKLTLKRVKVLILKDLRKMNPGLKTIGLEKVQMVWRSFREEWSSIETKLERQIFKLRVGDELQPGILKLAKVFVAQKEEFPLVIKWLVDTATRVLLLRLSQRKICHSWKMEHRRYRSKSFEYHRG